MLKMKSRFLYLLLLEERNFFTLKCRFARMRPSHCGNYLQSSQPVYTLRTNVTSERNKLCLLHASHPSKCEKLITVGRATLCTSCTQENLRTKDEKSEEKEAKESADNIPISLLGMGHGRNFRFQKHTLKKIVRQINQPDNEIKPEDSLPVAIKLMMKENKSELLKHYPFLENAISEKMTEVNDKDEVISEKTIYPFRLYSKNIGALVNDLSKSMHYKHKDKIQPLAEYLAKNFGQSETTDAGIKTLKDELWKVNYGKPDPSIPVSNIQCGGCGAYFHCQDPSLPGYIPSEKFKGVSNDDLLKDICQRCIYLQHFNIALNVNVNPSEYPKLISEIKDKFALVILIVDLTDFPCSIWPGIIDIIGEKRPIFVVGNKVDLLPCDSPGYLENVHKALKQHLLDTGIYRGRNVKHISLISAKTGYGVEELINKLYKLWEAKGDVYMVGCTNVGKSTLFNALLQSDFCKEGAVDLVQRATTSVWPGTTLNLLKFPIMKPNGLMLFLRTMRLKNHQNFEAEAKKLRKELWRETKNPQYITLMGRIGMTLKDDYKTDDPLKADSSGEQSSVYLSETADFDKGDFSKSNFCHDTPGAVYQDQILNLLTTEELTKTLSKQMITPRTFSVRESQTFFLAGLGRIDVLEIKHPVDYKNSANEVPAHVYITLFASDELPAHMVYTHEADHFYKINLGSLLAVPCGSADRLREFPPLEGKEFEVSGVGWKESCADIVLSSAGWVSITLGGNQKCRLKVYTPEGRGCYHRKFSMLKFAVNLKGKRIKGTPAFENRKCTIY